MMIFQLAFWNCSQVSKKPGEGAEDLLRALSSLGGYFLGPKPGNKPGGGFRIDPEPQGRITEDGDLYACFYSSPFLARQQGILMSGFEEFHPVGDLTYYHKSEMFDIVQHEREPVVFDALMKGQLSLAAEIYPLLNPRFAAVDEWATHWPWEKSVAKTELREVFWANFFSPSYVKKYGRKFLLNAPGWKKEELSDGGILYVVRESFLSWWKNKPKVVLEYFQQQIPGVKLHQIKPEEYF